MRTINIKTWPTRKLIKFLQDNQLDTDQHFIDFGFLDDKYFEVVIYQDNNFSSISVEVENDCEK